VAYFASIPAMMTNRLTRTSPEMFLERTLVYAPEEVQAAWQAEVMGKTLPTVQFVQNDAPKDWYRIYRDGPSSCMAGSHRIEQYAHPKNDLALAYVENKMGIPTHRAIVNTKLKTYVRVYGKEDTGMFVAALNKLGYRHSYDTLRDQRIWLEYASCYRCDGEVMIGPYLDGNYQGAKRINRDEGTIGGCHELYYGEEPYCGCESDDDDDYEEDHDEE
jgi:hypothetical protein